MTMAGTVVAPANVGMPQAAAVARATVGFLALGACAGLGSGALQTALQGGPSVLFVGVGTLLLTGPALVVVHQYLGLEARPIDVLGTLVTGFVAGGGLALGLAPVMLFFSATTALWGPVLVLSGLGCAATALTRTGLALYAIERSSAESVGRLGPAGLVFGWALLSASIGARLALELFVSH